MHPPWRICAQRGQIYPRVRKGEADALLVEGKHDGTILAPSALAGNYSPSAPSPGSSGASIFDSRFMLVA